MPKRSVKPARLGTTPQQSRSELSSVLMLRAARDLIGEHGYERTTLTAVGRRAGYSSGLVTRRFGSKEGLLVALVQRMSLTWTEITADKPDGSTAREVLHAQVEQFRDLWDKSPSGMRAVYTLIFEALGGVVVLRERITSLYRLSYEAVTGVVRRGIEEGNVDPSVVPEQVTRLFLGGLRGAAYQAMLDGPRVNIFETLDDVNLLIDAVLPPPTGKSR